ncbi:MAG: SpoIIE family protein phosphatase [Spirochaetaceae bacterium]|jgi:hypothetical protein|nr:SpoIIE family protein phosphatase [Spirochaetaceae bacterium]
MFGKLTVCAAVFFLFSGTIEAQRSFYWDNPVVFSPENGSFPQAAAGSRFAVAAWQESLAKTEERGEIFLSLAVLGLGEKKWSIRRHVAGPFSFAGTEPAIFTLTVDSRGRIILAVAASPSRVEIYISDDRGITFRQHILFPAGQSPPREGAQAAQGGDSLVPRVFQTSKGGYLLFITRRVSESITLFFASSQDGAKWQAFKNFVPEANMGLNFLPAHLVLNNMDIVVFQSFIVGEGSASFQLFMKTSADGGTSWSAAKKLTAFQDPVSNTTAPPEAFNNERVQISALNGDVFAVWERRFGSGSPAIYGAAFTTTGVLAGVPERINSTQVFCNNPAAFVYKNERHVVWFDNRRGKNGVVDAVRTPSDWENRTMSKDGDLAIFARPVEINGDLYVFWQGAAEGASSENRIFMLSRDMSVQAPLIVPKNFTSGLRAALDTAEIGWDLPYDSSGIEGFSWSWSREPQIEPPEARMGWAGSNSVKEAADEDGPWYFKLRALDFAGNWSESSGVVFVRDKTPPEPVHIIPLPLDKNGFAFSNSFTMRWDDSEAKDIDGYYWSLDFIGPAGIASPLPASAAPAALPQAVRVMGKAPNVNYENRDNGLWRFTVFPIDDVGNIGEGSAVYFKLNKYIPHTFITFLDPRQDFMGDLDLTIIGRGFSENGDISRIYFSRADTGDYERVLSYADGYTVDDDRKITLRRVENLSAGNYYIYVEHPIRGMARGPETIAVARSLTYKFGDFTRFWEPEWLVKLRKGFVFDVWTAVIAAALLFCAALLAFTTRGIAITLAEGRAIKIETRALLLGEEMPKTRRKLQRLRRQGLGLRFKLASFTVALVAIVAGMVSMPLYIIMNANQRQTLMQSLLDRSTVLLESLASGARTFLPLGTNGLPNVLELGFLPAQSAAVPEARYVTITGFSAQPSLTADYVWASNDPGIDKKLNTAVYQQGISRISDGVSGRITQLQDALNQKARDSVGALAESVAELTREGLNVAREDSEMAREELARIEAARRELDARATSILGALSSEIYTEPNFDVNGVEPGNRTYTLFKPVMFRQTGSDIYVRGWVRLEVSTASIVEKLERGRREILFLILTIVLAAIALGGALSFILATLIILPLRTLVHHIEVIRDTEDKTQLAGMHIEKKSSDEIGILTDTIKELVENLYKTAIESKELSLGKEIQKKFIPLELDAQGNKLTTGFKDTRNAEFFGYYEGAKGVSGDYFDYRDLDGRYYAIIKCDVAGKGIPAALIMIQVATMFINFFRQWREGDKDAGIEKLVYQINAFIEELGFKGRFAAFTLCLFDSETGIVRFCNAGDNVIHYYDASEHSFRTQTLPQTPATGVLPNELVKLKGGYQIQKLKLDHGDILLLYTDGIEEAKRKFRNRDFEEAVCHYHGYAEGTPHANHVVGQESEELGADRVEEIINAVTRRDEYQLVKYHNPHGNVRYHFDFTSCGDSVRDLIMALVSVEKIFRMWKMPSGGERILVDRRVDEFLREHFVEYDIYCGDSADYTENPEYMYYLNTNEDEQYDDLTILGIRRK